MENSIVLTDHTMKELLEHGSPEYPILISSRMTLYYNEGFVSWHWHEDFELTYVVSGHFEFFIGTDVFFLNPGEAVFINSKVLHQVKPKKNENPVYYSYAFAPELISESMQSLIAVKYIIPVMNNTDCPYYVFHENVSWERECLMHICALNEYSCRESFLKEFRIQHSLQRVFVEMIEHLPTLCSPPNTPRNNEHYLIMRIILFIKNNYAHQITLDDMANEVNISKSSCNRLFHKNLNMTPFEYLLNFRINQSRQMLAHSPASITEVAYSCGFHDISYFCKIFRQYTGDTPKNFRKQIMSHGETQTILFERGKNYD